MNPISTSPAEAWALLQAHHGRPEAAFITPRQRVAMALRHQEPDRVPFDQADTPLENIVAMYTTPRQLPPI